MAGFYSGQDGQLFMDDTQVAKVRSWSFTVNQAVLETVSLEDTDRTLIPGLRSVTGSCSLYYYQATAGGTTDTTNLLAKMITKNAGSGGEQGGGTKGVVKFQLKILDGNNDRSITFRAYLTSFAMTNSVGEVLSADVSFEVNGAVTGLDL
jgi:hypothetical protein